MPFNAIKKNVMSASGKAFEKIKETPGLGNIANKTESTVALLTDKKEIQDLVKEKMKMFEVVGLESFDLFKKGELDHHELTPFFNKIEQINIKIDEIQSKINQVTVNQSKKVICTCGQELDQSSKFCPSCGEKIVIDNNMDEGATKETTESKTCLCGEIVESNQTMCMECGRRII